MPLLHKIRIFGDTSRSVTKKHTFEEISSVQNHIALLSTPWPTSVQKSAKKAGLSRSVSSNSIGARRISKKTIFTIVFTSEMLISRLKILVHL